MLLAIDALVFVVIFTVLTTLFRTPLERPDESTFRVDVDNVNRHTIFEILWLRPILFPVYQTVQRLNMPKLKKNVMQLLLGLGNPRQYNPDEYLTLCVAWGGIGGVAFWMLAWAITSSISLAAIVLYLIVGFIMGTLGAYMALRERASRRLREISKRLPYTLDLVSMSMDAGATFYEATATVVRDEPEDPMNQELCMVIREIDFGRSRQDALMHLGRRITVDGLDGILSAVIQAESLGTPLADVLKLQANLLRMRRSMRAERKAGEAAVKMLIPTMLILVSVVLIIFIPILVKFMRGEFYK
jgi:tight adherence protein C